MVIRLSSFEIGNDDDKFPSNSAVEAFKGFVLLSVGTVELFWLLLGLFRFFLICLGLDLTLFSA
jgi:hypothetical protein